MIDKIKETFLDETHENLDRLENDLLNLESNPGDMETLNTVFRVLHSIKGSAAMFGYDEVGAFAHEVEAVLDTYRNEKKPATDDLISIILSSRDLIRVMIDDPDSTDDNERERITAILHAMLGKKSRSGKVERLDKGKKSNLSDSVPEKTYRIEFAPGAEYYHRGGKPESLVRELKTLGKTSIRCICSEVARLSEMKPDACYLRWSILLTTEKEINEVRDVFVFAEGTSDIKISELKDSDLFSGGEPAKLGEILIKKYGIELKYIKDALGKQLPVGEILIEKNIATQDDINDALFDQKHAKQIAQSKNEDSDRKTIRIRSDKLDGLMNLVGELITVQAQLSQAVKDAGDRKLLGITDYVKRLASELRSTSMELRLLPVETLFSKFKRLIRDLSKDLGKEIELNIEGGDTELDKSVVEALNDPLVHLVRNSIDHGIEKPDQRQISGKNRIGRITLSARHVGAFVRIVVKDDGGGVNKERVLAKALERGIVSADAHLSDTEIERLILKPGFSTAETVSNISGRGVGLDVVKTAIDQLGGSIDIVSHQGKGTEFILDIPLTLAIIDGFLARVGERMFVLPLSSVDSCFDREKPVKGERLISRGGEFIPYVDLREYFGIEDPISTESFGREEIVVVQVFDSKLALSFDQLLGGFQTVIKPIGEISRFARGVSGAAILADGGIALILDVAGMAKSFKETRN